MALSDKKRFVTKEGLKKLEEELQELKTVKRKEVAQRIQDAKELGDLSENAEYIEAKEEQGFIESRVLELEDIIKTSQIISHVKNTDTVQVGSTVRVRKDGEEFTYTIVGSSEANPTKQLISNESPLGKALLGGKIKDQVTIETPGGSFSCEILEIQ